MLKLVVQLYFGTDIEKYLLVHQYILIFPVRRYQLHINSNLHERIQKGARKWLFLTWWRFPHPGSATPAERGVSYGFCIWELSSLPWHFKNWIKSDSSHDTDFSNFKSHLGNNFCKLWRLSGVCSCSYISSELGAEMEGKNWTQAILLHWKQSDWMYEPPQIWDPLGGPLLLIV